MDDRLQKLEDIKARTEANKKKYEGSTELVGWLCRTVSAVTAGMAEQTMKKLK
ncbi:hypothetical protein [Helicobacter labacensis]|uniref:hypothetical protein n=1 Tax=Helicobacter labacensis TaxID=2316079 RepID=UPI0013CE0F9F|nr:hypothetical protein [Helicobacter labacensis]